MSKRNLYRIGSFFFFVVLFVMAGCKNQKAPESQSPYTDYEKAMTDKDTTEVTHLINLFFEYLEHDKVADAVLMLYVDDPDNPYGELQELDNDQIQKLMNAFKSVPIVDHRIEYIKFNETYANEVKVAAIISKAEGDMPEIKTYYYFRPVDYVGTWRLTLMNSGDGDRRLINNEKADSMKLQYEKELQEKESSKSENN